LHRRLHPHARVTAIANKTATAAPLALSRNPWAKGPQGRLRGRGIFRKPQTETPDIIEPLRELWKSRRFSAPRHLSAAKGDDALRRILRDWQADPDLGTDADCRLHIDRSTVEVNRA
jgi:hypothetical protein